MDKRGFSKDSVLLLFPACVGFARSGRMLLYTMTKSKDTHKKKRGQLVNYLAILSQFRPIPVPFPSYSEIPARFRPIPKSLPANWIRQKLFRCPPNVR